jgi:hypothetical protein
MQESPKDPVVWGTGIHLFLKSLSNSAVSALQPTPCVRECTADIGLKCNAKTPRFCLCKAQLQPVPELQELACLHLPTSCF